MSLDAYMHVRDAETDGPLDKFLLVHFASELSGSDGIGEIRSYEAIGACLNASADDVAAAFGRLVKRGYLVRCSNSESYKIAGFYQPRGNVVARKRQLSASVRAYVFNRDGFTCLECGCTDLAALTIDHIHPESKGGSHEVVNLQTLCRPCNTRKGARLP